MSGEPTYLKGQLLLDGGSLNGSFFHRAVVLICNHDAEGAFGLTLNQCAGDCVNDVLAADLPNQLKDLPVFLGGPVQPGALSFLHSDSFPPDANVMTGLHLDHSLDNLIKLGESWSTTRLVKIFAGYAGWSPGQLENEMARDSWLTLPATIDLVFNTDPTILWKSIIASLGPEYRLMADSPDDLSRN